MPQYVCDECGEVFDSKEELADHEHEDGFSFSPGFLDSIRSLTPKQVLAIVGAVLMSTLFLGPVFFYSTIGPSSGGGGSSPDVQRREPNPPVGYTVTSAADIPQVPESELPGSAVVDEQLGQDVQLYLLAGGDGKPAALLQYSCTGCSGTVSDLRSVAESFNSGSTWVYVAPYRDMDSRIAVTTFRSSIKLDSFNRTRITGFICAGLNNRPVRCAFEG